MFVFPVFPLALVSQSVLSYLPLLLHPVQSLIQWKQLIKSNLNPIYWSTTLGGLVIKSSLNKSL